MDDKGPRPFGISFVFIVMLLTGLFTIVVGVMRLIVRDGENSVTVVAGLVTVAVGLIYVLVARGVARGSRGARFLISFVVVLSIISAVWVLILSHGLWLSVTVQILLGLIVLALLYTARARLYFAR